MYVNNGKRSLLELSEVVQDTQPRSGCDCEHSRSAKGHLHSQQNFSAKLPSLRKDTDIIVGAIVAHVASPIIIKSDRVLTQCSSQYHLSRGH